MADASQSLLSSDESDFVDFPWTKKTFLESVQDEELTPPVRPHNLLLLLLFSVIVVVVVSQCPTHRCVCVCVWSKRICVGVHLQDVQDLVSAQRAPVARACKVVQLCSRRGDLVYCSKGRAIHAAM